MPPGEQRRLESCGPARAQQQYSMPRTAFDGRGEPWGKFGIGVCGRIVAAHHQASAWREAKRGEAKRGEAKRIRSRIHRSLIRLAATGRTCYALPIGVSTLISVEEYPSTLYRPDCDLVDGVLMERNVGRKDHSKLQGDVFAWFRARRRMLRLSAFCRTKSKCWAGPIPGSRYLRGYAARAR